MLYGLYQSAQGAAVQQRRLEATAHNLANAGTTGFKPDVAVVRTVPQFERALDAVFDRLNLPDAGDAVIGGGLADDRGLEHHNGATALADIVTDFSNGPIQKTGGQLDVAISGPGFFRVGTVDRSFLTRNGDFVVDAEGTLVTADGGLPVLDSSGRPIVLPLDAVDIGIGSSGLVTDRLATIADIELVQPLDPHSLTKLGGSLYADDVETAPVNPADTRLLQGYLESSGSEPMQEMVSMVEITRAFEMNMTMIQTQDASLGMLLKAASQV